MLTGSFHLKQSPVESQRSVFSDAIWTVRLKRLNEPSLLLSALVSIYLFSYPTVPSKKQTHCVQSADRKCSYLNERHLSQEQCGQIKLQLTLPSTTAGRKSIIRVRNQLLVVIWLYAHRNHMVHWGVAGGIA